MNDGDKQDLTITLKDGRKLGYAEFGDLNGKPVFYFHGHRSSRLEPKMYEIEKKQLGTHLIAVDRPGIGLSDFKKNRKILDWPSDILELASYLKIDKFAVLGGSGGAPYALSCAYEIPDRMVACGIISGLGPIEIRTDGMQRSSRLELSLGRKMPSLLKFLFWLQGRYLKGLKKKSKEKIIKTFQKRANSLPEPDRKILGDPKRIPLYLDLMLEPFSQGVKGLLHDSKLYSRYWGFDLKDITPSLKIYLWHGELDVSVPAEIGRSVCESIPNCKGKFFSNEGHFSVVINNIEEILTTLISQF